MFKLFQAMLRMVEVLDYFRMLNNVHAIFITASLFYKMSIINVSKHYSNQESCDKSFKLATQCLHYETEDYAVIIR